MTLTVPPDLYAAWLAARSEYDAAMQAGPASKTPYVQMRTEQIKATKNMATAAMRLLMSAEVSDV